MKPIEKGYSYCRFVYDGSDDVFEFAFVGGYINKAFIEVYKTSDEVGAEQTPLEYSLINEYSIRIDKSLLSVGDVVIVKRNTQAEKIIDFQAGALRTPKNLDTATQQAIDISVEAKDAYTAIEETIDQFNGLAVELFEASEATKIVADNIDSVNTDATNIDNINVVAGDFTGHTDPVSMPEWGEVGVERDPIYVPTGGNIYTVAKNIDSVNIDAENIEYIKKVVDSIDTIPDAATEVKQLTEQAKGFALNASNSASASELAKQGAETAKAQAEAVIPTVQEEAQTQISAITAKAEEQIDLIEGSGASQVQSVSEAGTAQVSVVTSEGNTQVQRVITEGDTQVSRVQQASATNIEQAEADAIEALETALSEHETALQGVGTAEVQKVQQQGSTSVSEVVSAKDTVIAEIVQAGDEQTARASAEADRAKEAADRAESSVSVQPDWNQTDSSQKDFIKNKPTLGTLAYKDVVAYNEVQGTPDLTLYWLKTDRLPAPDLGEVGVN